MVTPELPLPSWLLAGGFALLVPGFFAPRTAFAEPRMGAVGERAQLDVRASAEAAACPDRASLAGTITRALGRDVFGGDATDDGARGTALRIDVVFARSGAGYAATIRAHGARTGQRTILGNDPACSDLADAIAVTVAALLDGAEAPASPEVSSVASPPDSPVPHAPEAEESPLDSEPPRPRATGDTRAANNAAFLELLGSGLFYSINYERLLADGRFGVRVGVSYASLFAQYQPLSSAYAKESQDLVTIPLIVNRYLGGASHKFQMGGGAAVFYRASPIAICPPTLRQSDTGLNAAATFVLGYRYVASAGGASLGIAWTPSVGAGGLFWLWGGVSVGVVL
jgi:hypothetical protein